MPRESKTAQDAAFMAANAVSALFGEDVFTPETPKTAASGVAKVVLRGVAAAKGDATSQAGAREPAKDVHRSDPGGYPARNSWEYREFAEEQKDRFDRTGMDDTEGWQSWYDDDGDDAPEDDGPDV